MSREGGNNCKGDIFAVHLHQLDSILLKLFFEERELIPCIISWCALPVYPGVDTGFDSFLFIFTYSISLDSNSHRLWKQQSKIGRGQIIFLKLITIVTHYIFLNILSKNGHF